MAWDVVAGNALGLISTILKFVKDNRLFKRKKEFEELLMEIRTLEEKSDEETDDNLLHHKRNELNIFLGVWKADLESSELEK